MDRELHNKALKWHEEYLKWAEENNLRGTEDYEVAKYALKCIKFKKNSMI